MSEELTVPAGSGRVEYPILACPHCAECQYPSRIDEHIATAHADIPPCTATADIPDHGKYACVLRVGHGDSEYGAYHVSAHGPVGRTFWSDTAPGAVPHEEESHA